MMLSWAISAGIVGLAISTALAMVRVFIGPSLPDRLVSLDTIAVNGMGLIVLYGLQQRAPHYLDAAVLMAILSFIGTVAAAKYIQRGRIVDRDGG